MQLRRYPCPGCVSRHEKHLEMIWKEYIHGVMTYQVGAQRCRKCARRANRQHDWKEYLKRREKNKERRFGNNLKIVLPRMAEAAKE